MLISQKMNVSTQMHKKGHNSACDQQLFMRLAPLYSEHSGLSIHAKNSVLMKNPQWSLISQPVTYDHITQQLPWKQGQMGYISHKFIYTFQESVHQISFSQNPFYKRLSSDSKIALFALLNCGITFTSLVLEASMFNYLKLLKGRYTSHKKPPTQYLMLEFNK